MASIYTRPGSPFYWLRYLESPGKWKSKSTGVRIDSPGGRRKAMGQAQIESAGESDLRDGAFGQALNHWVPAFLKQRYELRQPKGYLRYSQCWSALSIYLQDAGVTVASQVTKKIAKDYAYWRINPPRESGVKKAKWNTAIIEIKLLALIMDEAVDRGYITGNPCVRLGLKRERPKEKNVFTPEDEAAVEAALEAQKKPDWMKISWKIAMLQGCRISETQIPLAWVDLKADPPTIRFRIKRDARGDRFHIAPLHPELIPIIEALHKAKAKFTCELPPSPGKVWHKWLRTLDLSQEYSFHSTRVTVVTKLAAANFSQPMVKDYVGHASTTVNDVYRKLRPRDLVSLSDSLSAKKVEKTDSP